MSLPRNAWIVDGVRTPIGRYGGALASIRTDDLAALPIRALMSRNPDVDWGLLDDVLYGCANQAGEDNRNVARMAALLAGLPESVPRHVQSPLRVRPRGARAGSARLRTRRGRTRGRGRGRGHDAGAVRARQGGGRPLDPAGGAAIVPVAASSAVARFGDNPRPCREDDVKEVRRSALVPYSATRMFALVADVERYPEFLPWVAAARLHEKSEHDLLASMEMQRGGVRERFTTRNEFDRPTYMTMQLVEGPFRLLAGRWTFTPIGTAGTRVELEMRFEFANPVVSLLFGNALEQSCNSLIDAFIARARTLRPPGSA